MDEFSQDLTDIILNETIDPRFRSMAKSMLRNWINGITPSPKEMRRLREATRKPNPCGKEEYGSACKWLRKRGKEHDLPVPPPGEPARCLFGSDQHRCPGYTAL